MEKLNSSAPLFNLPKELWLDVFELLKLKDLKNVKLVCRYFYKLCQSAKLLNKSRLMITAHNLEAIVDTVLANEKFPYLQIFIHKNIIMSSVQFQPQYMRGLYKLGQRLECLVIRQCQVLPYWSANLFPKLQVLDMDASSLQFEEYISTGTLYLNTLILEFSNDLSFRNGIAILNDSKHTVQHLDLSVGLRVQTFDFLCEEDDLFPAIKNLHTLRLNGIFNQQSLKHIFETLSAKANRIRCLNLREVEMNDDIFKTIIQKWSDTLQEVTLGSCYELTNYGFEMLRATTRNLFSFCVSTCAEVTSDALVRAIASTTNPVLRSLQLHVMCHINDSTLCTLCERLPNLNVLAVNYNAISNKSLGHISKYLKNLRTLQLRKIIYDEFEIPVFSFNKLKSSTLRVITINCADWLLITEVEHLVNNCPNLEELSIDGCINIDDDTILLIATKLHKLRCLHISFCRNLSETSLEYIATYCTNLEELGFHLVPNWSFKSVLSKLLRVRPNVQIYC